ncbi:MAG: motif protein [Rariglobus sp.]|nr:motif protein [Rariglobus sp.]
MKTKSNAVFSVRFGALLGWVGVMMSASVSGQTADVDLVVMEKFSDHRQTDASTTVPHSSPYGFAVIVEGSNLAPLGFTAPTFISAAGSGTAGGTLIYDEDEGQWSEEISFSSQTDLNTAFADGTYTVSVGGTTVELVQSGDLYPNTPMVATFSQGFWSGGVYYFDPTQDLTITTNAFTAYDSYIDGMINIFVNANAGPGYDQDAQAFHDQAGGANTLSLTIDAFELVGGQTLELELGFSSIVDDDADLLLPGALIVSVYSTFTFVQLQAIPEPSTYAMLVGGAGLAVAVWVRRRRR